MMDETKQNFISSMIFHIVNINEWTNPLGYYIYYKEHLKTPSKKLIKSVDDTCMRSLISNINNGDDIDDNMFVQKKRNAGKKKIDSTISNVNIIEPDDNRNYIRMDENYKFTGTNPYDDLKKKEHMSDKIYKEMIYMRSRFSKSGFSKFQYRLPENFVLSQI
jgi:hypothetical protein